MAKKRKIKKLTPNQKIFADEYCIDRNGTRAYKAAYPRVKKDNTAATNARRQLRKAHIAAYIEKRLKKISEKTRLDTEFVFDGWRKMATSNVIHLFNDDGTLKPLSEIPEETLFSIQGIEVRVDMNSKKGDKAPARVIKFKLIDKKGVFDSIARHLGMFEKDNRQRNGLYALLKAMKEIEDQPDRELKPA